MHSVWFCEWHFYVDCVKLEWIWWICYCNEVKVTNVTVVRWNIWMSLDYRKTVFTMCSFVVYYLMHDITYSSNVFNSKLWLKGMWDKLWLVIKPVTTLINLVSWFQMSYCNVSHMWGLLYDGSIFLCKFVRWIFVICFIVLFDFI